jgi:hypothetical protein
LLTLAPQGRNVLVYPRQGGVDEIERLGAGLSSVEELLPACISATAAAIAADESAYRSARHAPVRGHFANEMLKEAR